MTLHIIEDYDDEQQQQEEEQQQLRTTGARRAFDRETVLRSDRTAITTTTLTAQQGLLLLVKICCLYIQRLECVETRERLQRDVTALIRDCRVSERPQHPHMTAPVLHRTVQRRLPETLGRHHWERVQTVMRAYCAHRNVRLLSDDNDEE